jgi:hypothetical protein
MYLWPLHLGSDTRRESGVATKDNGYVVFKGKIRGSAGIKGWGSWGSVTLPAPNPFYSMLSYRYLKTTCTVFLQLGYLLPRDGSHDDLPGKTNCSLRYEGPSSFDAGHSESFAGHIKDYQTDIAYYYLAGFWPYELVECQGKGSSNCCLPRRIIFQKFAGKEMQEMAHTYFLSSKLAPTPLSHHLAQEKTVQDGSKEIL